MKRFILIVLVVLAATGCRKSVEPDYRAEMRAFVRQISIKAKQARPGFIIIPQNGHQLISSDGSPGGTAVTDYLNAIDGLGREDLFYGYDADDAATPGPESDEMKAMMDMALGQGKTILVTDYCFTQSKMDDSYSRNNQSGFISFAADHRELDHIPAYPAQVFQANNDSVSALSGAKNFLYLINPENFSSRNGFIQAVAASAYDLVIMDLFFNDGTAFTASEIAQLRNKPGGGTRKIICYMSIGEAENYRYYWKDYWNSRPPSFILSENPSWTGNYKVKYWDEKWQGIIFKDNHSYLNRILDAGFDGVYLDIVDGFEFFEEI
ncbi:MAG: glycoside hydrolase [Bacteroidetes bacterium]|nr:MAG: glycoside hydrolase [Bacteroidota bacterium]